MPGLSTTSACVYTTAAVCTAFIAGRGTSIYYIGAPAGIPTQFNQNYNDTHAMQPSQHANAKSYDFPLPVLIAGKASPKTKYTSMVSSDVLSSTAGYATLHLDTEASLNDIEEVCIQTDDGHSKCSIDVLSEEDYEEAFRQMEEANANASNDEKYLPAGQHLLLDIERVNSEFLNDEVRLAKAMVGVVNESKLTLLSYHCHKLIPMGVSCVGVLLESHISFHTWPGAGVITLDLFTCGSGNLIPVLPILKKLFAIPQEGARDILTEQPRTLWTHKLRGFREFIQPTDLIEAVLEASNYELKEEIASVQTPFQRIDIYDLLTMGEDDYPAYEKYMLGGDTYEARNPMMFNPNRIVFLDGVMQSEREGNAAYHEPLVHPAMFFHPDPKRVAIIGGGEGATLREVLKHNTVDTVKMIEIDEMMVQVSREFLPDWNNCSDLVGSTEWCGDDERAEMHYVDAFGWFNDRFATGVEEKTEEKFDVLIMDALDPEDDIPFAEMLYNDYDFIETLYNSLTDNGLIVLQLGEASSYSDPAEQFSKSSRRSFLIDLLEEVGFQTMHFFEDGNCGFDAPWSFLVAAKDEDVDARWYMSDAAVEIDIRERTVRTVSGTSPLKYFDSSVKKGYHYPHKHSETVFCRTIPTPESCNVKDERRSDIPLSAFEVRMSGAADGSGRGVYTTVDIKKGSSIARKDSTTYVHAPSYSMESILDYKLESLYNYLDGYGWEMETWGGDEFYVEPSFMTFVNHGCNGTSNIIEWPTYKQWVDGIENAITTEQNVTRADYEVFRAEVFDLHHDRHMDHIALTYSVAKRDIKAGEEMLTNYVGFSVGEELWWKEVKSLQRMCSGEEVGFITKKEKDV